MSALNTKWITKNFPEMLQKTACPSAVSKLTFKQHWSWVYLGGGAAVAGTEEQKSWWQGRGGCVRDSTGWWRELCLKTEKEEKRRYRRPGEKSEPRAWAWFSSLSSKILQKGPHLRPPSPYVTMMGKRENQPLCAPWTLGSCLARSHVQEKSPSYIWREKSTGMKNSEMGMGPGDVTVTPPATHIVIDPHPHFWFGFLCLWYHCEWVFLICFNSSI